MCGPTGRFRRSTATPAPPNGSAFCTRWPSPSASRPNQVVLAWLLGNDPPELPVLGVSSVAQLDECLRAAELHIDESNRYRLDTAGQAFTVQLD
jgi:aryl-alcohol dehydrogenase-like predicted oxidoreductase